MHAHILATQVEAHATRINTRVKCSVFECQCARHHVRARKRSQTGMRRKYIDVQPRAWSSIATRIIPRKAPWRLCCINIGSSCAHPEMWSHASELVSAWRISLLRTRFVPFVVGGVSDCFSLREALLCRNGLRLVAASLEVYLQHIGSRAVAMYVPRCGHSSAPHRGSPTQQHGGVRIVLQLAWAHRGRIEHPADQRTNRHNLGH